MKIGILTFADVPNFGANLQALSTVCYLKNHGYDPVLIKWTPLDFEKRFVKTKNQVQQKKHFDFVKNNLPWTDLCRNDDEICDVIEKECIDAIIIGSDAVLQHVSLLSRVQFPSKRIIKIMEMTSERIFPNAFWGTFYSKLGNKIPMAIMSASSQNSNYRLLGYSVRQHMTNCLKNFNYISVRDMWTKNMIYSVSGHLINPLITPDPVFAFNNNCEGLIPTKNDIIKRFSLPENYVLVSMKGRLLNNENWMNELKMEFEKYNMVCVALPMPDGVVFKHNFDIEIKEPLSPLDWYALIKYANGYVGENMHPIVVALHNSVPCFSFDTYGALKLARLYCIQESSKIYDILQQFDILNFRCNAAPRFWKCPKASVVVNKMLSFDIQSCRENSKHKLQEYIIMMDNIMNSFNICNK